MDRTVRERDEKKNVGERDMARVREMFNGTIQGRIRLILI